MLGPHDCKKNIKLFRHLKHNLSGYQQITFIFRLCGFPPFYSNHGLAISPGMKKRIRSGQYEFPKPEWENISKDAKSLIQGMLITDPSKRFTIDEVIKNKWIAVCIHIPIIKIHCPRFLNHVIIRLQFNAHIEMLFFYSNTTQFHKHHY